MPRKRPGARLTIALWLALAGCGGAAAQPTGAPAATAPVTETRQMIDALKPPLNRGMRNLLVRQAATAPAASAAAETHSSVVATSSVAPPAPVPSAAAAGPAVAVSAVAPSQTAAPEAPPSLSLAIQFETNSARVRPESGEVLGNLVAAMLSPDLRGNRFMIEGHTDARGLAANNQRLSLQRAEEVRLYLVALGVHPGRLRAVGKGASEPANAGDPLAADNRRVRVVTLE